MSHPDQEPAPLGPAFRVASALCVIEWAAYFGVYVSLTLYLTRAAGFTDVQTGWVIGTFGAIACVLPTAAGAIADRVGYRRSMIVGYALLAAGYAVMFLLPGRPTAIAALSLNVTGMSLTRTAVMGTGARSSDAANRARAYSILMQMINVGCFIGKAVARPIRVEFGIEYMGLWALAVAALALVTVVFAYREEGAAEPTVGGGVAAAWKGIGRVVRNGRFVAVLVVAGVFWAVQGQLYATMPRYVTRLVGDATSPEWYANVNPIVVMLLIVPITRATCRMSSGASLAVAMALVTLSAAVSGLGASLASWVGPEIALPWGGAIGAQAAVMVAGAALSGLGECFLLPRYLEFTSMQAPAGETALYLGFGYLNGLVSNALGYWLSGYLVDRWCPDPATLSPLDHAAWERALAGLGPMPDAYAAAPWIWFLYAGFGAAALVGMAVLARRARRRGG